MGFAKVSVVSWNIYTCSMVILALLSLMLKYKYPLITSSHKVLLVECPT